MKVGRRVTADQMHASEPVIEYGRMTEDELVEHLIDENGLVAFIDTQQAETPYEDWEWREITLHLQAFSKGYLTFSPEYLKDLYDMQTTRQADV